MARVVYIGVVGNDGGPQKRQKAQVREHLDLVGTPEGPAIATPLNRSDAMTNGIRQTANHSTSPADTTPTIPAPRRPVCSTEYETEPLSADAEVALNDLYRRIFGIEAA